MAPDDAAVTPASRGPRAPARGMSLLCGFDAAAASARAQVEVKRREAHLPPVSTYRWWARRTEAVFGGVLDAAATNRPGRLVIADPFAGGGVISLAAALRGHQVYAQDINPWATRGLAAMLSLHSPSDIEAAADALHRSAKDVLDGAYTTAFEDGEPATIAHTLRVASSCCGSCGRRSLTFPHALVTLTTRRDLDGTNGWLACPFGHLTLGRLDRELSCGTCEERLRPDAEYGTGRLARCPHCAHVERLDARALGGSWRWEVALVQRLSRQRRQISPPTPAERAQAAESHWQPQLDLGQIAQGRETGVLRRYGFTSWNDLYPARQRAVMETLRAACQDIDTTPAVRELLRLAICGAGEMAGHLSRWDRYYLKPYEAMAGHRFNVTMLATEPHVWGVPGAGRGTVARRLQGLAKAAAWLASRVETPLRVQGPIPARSRRTVLSKKTAARIVTGGSQRMLLPASSVDLVLTDPPYHDDIQYDELSLLLRAWAGLGNDRLTGEAVAIGRQGRNREGEDYCRLLGQVFEEVKRILRPTGHLLLSYANRNPQAWADLFAALQQAGFQAVGHAIVHSENEHDYTKRAVRACTLDLLLDLIPQKGHSGTRTHPTPDKSTISGERSFLALIAGWAAHVGRLEGGWETEFLAEASKHPFIADTGPRKQTAPHPQRS
jgi:putative DNA methylase